MRGWRLIAAGVVLFWGWVLIASAIWPGDDTPVIGQVLSLALYRHATGRSTGPFSGDELKDALVRRRKLR